MEVRGRTTREIAVEIGAGVMNGVLRAKVLDRDALVHTNTWKATNPQTGVDEYFIKAQDLASQDPQKLGGEDEADEEKQSLIDTMVAWTKWGDPIIY